MDSTQHEFQTENKQLYQCQCYVIKIQYTDKEVTTYWWDSLHKPLQMEGLGLLILTCLWLKL